MKCMKCLQSLADLYANLFLCNIRCAAFVTGPGFCGHVNIGKESLTTFNETSNGVEVYANLKFQPGKKLNQEKF